MKTEQYATEAQFQDAVADLARLLGWKVAHFRNARTSSGGHHTPVSYDGRGFPDLVLVRDRVVFAELKSERGRLRDQQLEWIDDLADAGVEAYCWRPSDWPVIEQSLTRRSPLTGSEVRW